MKSPNVDVNWLQFVTSVGVVGGPARGEADERGDGRAHALDRTRPGLDLLDVDAGRQIVRHAWPFPLREIPDARDARTARGAATRPDRTRGQGGRGCPNGRPRLPGRMPAAAGAAARARADDRAR